MPVPALQRLPVPSFNEAAGFTQRKRASAWWRTRTTSIRFNEAAGFTQRKPRHVATIPAMYAMLQ